MYSRVMRIPPGGLYKLCIYTYIYIYMYEYYINIYNISSPENNDSTK